MNMNKKRKLSFVISCLIAFTSVFSGCSNVNEEVPESSVSAVQEETAAVKEETAGESISESESVTSENITSASDDTETDTQTSPTVSEETETTVTAVLDETKADTEITTSEEETQTEKSKTETKTETEIETEVETETETEAETTKGWSETQMSDTVLYVKEDCVGRDSASNDGAVVTKYAKGEALVINALTDSGFYKIKDNNEYVHAFYLSDSPLVSDTSQTTEVVTEISAETETTSASQSSDTDVTVTDGSELYKSRYAYNTLTDDEKTLYASIVSAAYDFDMSVDVPDGISKNDAFKVCLIVYNEEPQLFWLDSGFTVNMNIVTLKYKTSKSNISSMQEKINANVSPLLAKINAASSDYDKLKLMYDYVVLHNDFSLDSSGYNPTIYNAFTSSGELQCAGYAKAIQYLCDKAGIDSTVVVGKNTSGDSHAWNVVKCNGKYYNLDATWGDPMNPSNGKIDYNSDYIRYTYFLVPDSIVHDISHLNVNEYNLSSDSTIKLFTPPTANSETYNYFKQEGLYFTDVDEAKEAIKVQIEKAVSNKFQGVQIRVSTDIFSEIFSDKNVLEYQKYAKSLSDDVTKLLTYRTETYKKTGVVTIDIVYA